FLNQTDSSAKTKTIPLSGKDKNHMRAIECFDNLEIHAAIKKVSRKLFVDKHYAQAILEAFKKVNNMVKIKSGRTDLDGKNLMTTVFSRSNPVLRLNELKTVTDLDQQEGYMHLFAGAIQGIRNPKAHDEIVQNNPFTTVKFLCFANMLAQKVDETTVM
ncbi:MAG: TIGR02391 family protein, partial [Nitrospirae bacterium]|nr:TIGR02391 family protein [Nitrospirota bacterium]